MPVSKDYLGYVLEQLAGLPRVTSRRMFGAIGLYSDGLFFGLIDNDTLFFKVNDSNRGDYVARNMAPFQPFPDKPDKPDLSMSYFTVPADALEDRDELVVWARKSVAVAALSPKARRPRTEKSAAPAGKARSASQGAGRVAARKAKRTARRAPARKR